MRSPLTTPKPVRLSGFPNLWKDADADRMLLSRVTARYTIPSIMLEFPAKQLPPAYPNAQEPALIPAAAARRFSVCFTPARRILCS
jgi:hypothetical protein